MDETFFRVFTHSVPHFVNHYEDGEGVSFFLTLVSTKTQLVHNLGVKLTSMQLVGESIAAISVPLEAILKLENMDYCWKRLSESAVLLI